VLLQELFRYNISIKGLTYEEIEKAVHETLLEEKNLKKALLRCNRGVLKALQDINRSDEAELDCAQVYALSQLSEDGYGRFDYFEEYCIDEACLNALCALINDRTFMAVWEKATYTYPLMEYAAALYGIIDENVLFAMYQEKWPDSSLDEMKEMWHLVEDSSIVYHAEEHAYYRSSLFWDGTYEEVKAIQEQYEMDLLTVEDVEDVFNYGFPYSKQSYQELLGYLAYYFGDEMPSKNYERVVELFQIARAGGDLEGYIEEYLTKIKDFTGEGPIFPSTRYELMTYIYNCAGETRIALLNGHYMDDALNNDETLEELVNYVRDNPEDLMRHMPEDLPVKLEEAFAQLMESLGEEEFDEGDDEDDLDDSDDSNGGLVN
jgi:hypothetical protein